MSQTPQQRHDRYADQVETARQRHKRLVTAIPEGETWLGLVAASRGPASAAKVTPEGYHFKEGVSVEPWGTEEDGGRLLTALFQPADQWVEIDVEQAEALGPDTPARRERIGVLGVRHVSTGRLCLLPSIPDNRIFVRLEDAPEPADPDEGLAKAISSIDHPGRVWDMQPLAEQGRHPPPTTGPAATASAYERVRERRTPLHPGMSNDGQGNNRTVAPPAASDLGEWGNTIPRELADTLLDREDEHSTRAAQWLFDNENDDRLWVLVGQLLDRITQMADQETQG